jgi:phosphoglycolate phosphatase-like HAD superfamily hydrolase
MVRLVLFDIDGTLIRTGGAGLKAFARVCESQFGVVNGATRLSFAGRTDPSIVRDFFQHHNIEPSDANFRKFFEAYVFILDELLRQKRGRILPGVKEMLCSLRAMQPSPVVGLLTGNIRLGAEIKLRHHGLWQEFQVGGFGDDDEDRNRIAAVARRRGCQMAGVELRGEEILVVGDTPHDITCGRAIGARLLSVATGSFTREQLESHHPCRVVETLAEVDLAELMK